MLESVLLEISKHLDRIACVLEQQADPSAICVVPSDFPAQIIEKRRRLGLTQYQFAELINSNQSLVTRWENGRSRPSPAMWDILKKLEEHNSR